MYLYGVVGILDGVFGILELPATEGILPAANEKQHPRIFLILQTNLNLITDNKQI